MRILSFRWLAFLFLLFLCIGQILWPRAAATVPTEPLAPSLPAQVVARTPVITDDEPWTLLAVGDIMLSRYVGVLQKRSGDPAFPFGDVSDLISSADLAFANLENPIADGPPVKMDGLIFRMDPALTPRLAQAGFDVVSIANNHMTDAGLEGVASTQKALSAAGLSFAGAGATAAEARSPALLRVGGRTVAFLAYGDPRFYRQVRFAAEKTAGIAKAEEESITADVAAARAQADVVIVSFHAGTEYADLPDEVQQRLATAAVDAGADLVLGHHPHVLQPLRWQKGVPIAFSLGNFVFDQIGDNENLSAALQFTFRGRTVTEVTVVPLKIEGSAPKTATGAAVTAVLKRLGVQSFVVMPPSSGQDES